MAVFLETMAKTLGVCCRHTEGTHQTHGEFTLTCLWYCCRSKVWRNLDKRDYEDFVPPGPSSPLLPMLVCMGEWCGVHGPDLLPYTAGYPHVNPLPHPGKGISRKEQRCPSISCVRRRPAACCMHPSCGQGYNVPACFLLSVLWHWPDHPRLLAFTPLGCHGVPSPLGTVVKGSRNSTLCIRNPLLATLWEYFPTWGHRGRSRTLGIRKFNEISFLNSDRHLGYQERQTNPHPGKLESGREQGVCHTALEFSLAFLWVQLGFWKWEPVTKLSCKLDFNWNCLFLNGSFSAEPEAHGCRLSVQEAGARRGIPWQFKTSQIHRLSSA